MCTSRQASSNDGNSYNNQQQHHYNSGLYPDLSGMFMQGGNQHGQPLSGEVNVPPFVRDLLSVLGFVPIGEANNQQPSGQQQQQGDGQQSPQPSASQPESSQQVPGGWQFQFQEMFNNNAESRQQQDCPSGQHGASRQQPCCCQQWTGIWSRGTRFMPVLAQNMLRGFKTAGFMMSICLIALVLHVITPSFLLTSVAYLMLAGGLGLHLPTLVAGQVLYGLVRILGMAEPLLLTGIFIWAVHKIFIRRQILLNSRDWTRATHQS